MNIHESPCPADQLGAWRKSLDPAADVAVVAGSFHMLQPGNLTAIRVAKKLAGHVCVLVEPDQAQSPDSRPPVALEERLELVSQLRDVDIATSFRAGEAASYLAGLKPYTWVFCEQQVDGPLGRHASDLADRRVPIPALGGCFTSEIIAAIRECRTPIRLPAAFHDAGPVRTGDLGGSLVTVNGCFDVLHVGHIRFLAEAGRMGSVLTVLINDDASVRRYKGSDRPVFPAEFRAAALLSLKPVSAVRVFPEDNPLRLIAELRPSLHVKGGSYEPSRVEAERDLLAGWGGRVAFCAMVEGRSTTGYLDRVTRP